MFLWMGVFNRKIISVFKCTFGKYPLGGIHKTVLTNYYSMFSICLRAFLYESGKWKRVLGAGVND